MVNSDTVTLLPLTFPLIAVVAGVLSRRSERAYHAPLIGAPLAAIAVALLAAGTHESGVSSAAGIAGAIGAGVMLGALPVCVFFALGFALARRLVVLGVVCAASVVPTDYFYFIGWLFTLALTACPPDAYECPI